MKAIVVRAQGGPEVLKLEDVADAKPEAGQVLVNVAAAGVNFLDTGSGLSYAGRTNFPLTPGIEGAGTVAAVGSGVSDLRVGDRVSWFSAYNSYAEQVIVPADALVPLPDDIDFDTAAGLMMQGLTASTLVIDGHPIKPGDVALIHAAAGGVGLLTIQAVKLLGGKVIGRVSSAAKVAIAKQAGADEVIVDATGSFADAVMELTGGRGVDVVYDGTGGESFKDSMRSVDFFGTLALFGPLMDPLPLYDFYALPKSIKVTFPIVHHHVRTHDLLIQRSQELFEWVRQGRMKVHVQRYTLAEAARAHTDILSRTSVGKLLLIP